jgi:hypothetical protein
MAGSSLRQGELELMPGTAPSRGRPVGSVRKPGMQAAGSSTTLRGRCAEGEPSGGPEGRRHRREGRRGTSFPMPESHFEVAVAWLRALKTGRAPELAAITALPLTFATTRTRKRCEGKVNTATALERWVACVQKSEASWLTELEVPGEPPLAEAGADPAKLVALMKRVGARPSSWVRASMSRDGLVYTFRLAIDGASEPRVGAFLIDVARESG